MFEPLTRTVIPNHLGQLTRAGMMAQDRNQRRLIIIAQAWPMPWAEHNTAQIAALLIARRGVPVVMSGDVDHEAEFVRPPATIDSDRLEQEITRSERALLGGERSVMDHLAVAFRDVHLGGVNEGRLLREGQQARARRRELLHGLGYREVDGRFEIPLFGRLADELDRVCDRRMSPRLRRARRALADVHDSMDRLPELVHVLADLGIDLTAYPSVQRLARAVLAGRATIGSLAVEHRRLTRAVLERLGGGRIDPVGGLTAAFDAQIRRAWGDVLAGDRRPAESLMTARRPLAFVAEQLLREITQALLDAVESNRITSVVQAAALLDCAAKLQLNDRLYRQLRRYVGACLAFPVSTGTYVEELERLRADTQAMLGDRSSDTDWRLVALADALRDAERVVQETVGGSRAARLARRPPSLDHIASELVALGGELSDAERTAARDLEGRDDAQGPLAYGIEFCRNAIHQSRVMATRIPRAMQDRGANLAILVCGGFHAHVIADILESKRQFAVSVLIPHIQETAADDREVDPEKLRKSLAGIFGANVQLHIMGRSLEEALLGKDSPEARARPAFGSQDDQGARQWLRLHGTRALSQREIPTLDDRPAHECRICHRIGPLETGFRNLVCAHYAGAAALMQCPECRGSYLCADCAGRSDLALFPGHGRGDARRLGGRTGVVVCNRHDLPLEAQAPYRTGHRVIGDGLPGQSWFR